jgi:serine/threonine protein phosphatase PrpC
MGEGGIELPLPIFDVKDGDRFLLCSDGLSSVLSDKEIKSLLKGKDRDDAVNALIDATYINGAPDNVTIVVADIVESSQSDGFMTLGAAT